MDMNNISLPEVYLDSEDFRLFKRWFVESLTKTQYDTENIFDLYDPLRCPTDLVWALADTMGFRYDDRLPASFNRLVLVYFMSMIYNRGSRDGVTLAAETNLAQFVINDRAENDPICYERLDDTSIPVNSVSVTPHTSEGYIDIVYFSDRVPKDACVEYVRPIGMYAFQYAGVRYDARTRISIDPRLTDSRDVGMSYGPTQVGHYRRDDYARLQKMGPPTELDTEDVRQPVWYRNSKYEDITNGDGTYGSGTDPNMDPGYRALYSLQMANNEHVVKALLGPIFTLGFGPQDLETEYPEDYYKMNPGSRGINLRYDKQREEDNTPEREGAYDIYTVDDYRSEDNLDFKPRVNPRMVVAGDAISITDDNTVYAGDIIYDPTDENDYIYTIEDNEATIIYYIGASIRPAVPTTLGGAPVVKIAATAFTYRDVYVVAIPEGITIIE